MSLYAEYLKERLGYETVEIDGVAFASYQVLSDAILVAEIFVKPENRNKGYCRKIVELIADIANQSGIEFIVGQVAVGSNGCENMLSIALSHGAEIINAQNGTISFRWRIK